MRAFDRSLLEDRAEGWSTPMSPVAYPEVEFRVVAPQKEEAYLRIRRPSVSRSAPLSRDPEVDSGIGDADVQKRSVRLNLE
jgi:hypothetical protein